LSSAGKIHSIPSGKVFSSLFCPLCQRSLFCN
jgi:hypothetical protein